jgi:hypothetical protein
MLQVSVLQCLNSLNSGPAIFLAAAAFGVEATPISPLATPVSMSEARTPISCTSPEAASDASHSAASAAKNKRVSGLVSQYLDKVVKEPLPGDSLGRPHNASPTYTKLKFVPKPSPMNSRPIHSQIMALPEVDTTILPDIGSVRAKFEQTARSSDSSGFEFGEAFRQKQRFSLLVGKEKEKEARVSMRGFDEMIVSPARTSSGEVDTSKIEKSFVFHGLSDQEIELHDGKCKVDYTNKEYMGYVFVIHRTRGKSFSKFIWRVESSFCGR